MGSFAVLAEGLSYPTPGRLEALQAAPVCFPVEAARHWGAFLRAVSALPLGAWEELYTQTWDLDPIAAPYIGFQTWGESYKRGEYMARLSQVMNAAGIDYCGEMPDHLIPVLRWLDVVNREPNPPAPFPKREGGEELAELFQPIPPAVERMLVVMSQRAPTNPYAHLLESILCLLQTLKFPPKTP